MDDLAHVVSAVLLAVARDVLHHVSFGETELVGSAIHYLDAEVADLVEARFIRFIPDGQLGKLASEIALVRGR